MIRRRTMITSAMVAAAALGLAACSDDPSDPSNASDGGGNSVGTSDGGGEAGPGLEAISVSEDLGSEPVVDFPHPLSITEAEARIVVAGDGPVINEGDYVIWRSLYADAEKGEVLQSWWQGAPATGVRITADSVGEQAFAFFTTASIGSRFAMTGWQTDYMGTPVPLVQVADIDRKVEPMRADGETREPSGTFPSVTLADNGAPSLDEPPSGEPPAETTVETLIEGTGEKTQAGDFLTMHYTGWSWENGEQFDSSWERGEPFGFEQGKQHVIPGWENHLLDLPVGSQVMLVIPPQDAYGEEQTEQNPLGGQTLVFVIDVLDAARPASS